MQAGEQTLNLSQLFEMLMRARKDVLSVPQKPFSQFKLEVNRCRTYEGDLTAARPDSCSRFIFIMHLNEYKEHPLRKSLWTEVYIPIQDYLSSMLVPAWQPGDVHPFATYYRSRLDRWLHSWCISAPWFMDDIESSIAFWLIAILGHGKRLDTEDIPHLMCLPEDPVMPKAFDPVFQDPYPIFPDLHSAKQFDSYMQICEMIPNPYHRRVLIRSFESSFAPRLESPEDFVRRIRRQFDVALGTYMAEYPRYYVERKSIMRDAKWLAWRIAGRTLREIVDEWSINGNADPVQTVKRALERFAIGTLGFNRQILTAAKRRKVHK